MDSTRRCFRIVETILVERNVEEVRSGIETEKERVDILLLFHSRFWR